LGLPRDRPPASDPVFLLLSGTLGFLYRSRASVGGEIQVVYPVQLCVVFPDEFVDCVGDRSVDVFIALHFAEIAVVTAAATPVVLVAARIVAARGSQVSQVPLPSVPINMCRIKKGLQIIKPPR